MKIGYHAPLPPAPTGVADYAAQLLRELTKLGRVEIEPRTADLRLYHLGNNHLHKDIYRRAIEEPGVVVMHDGVLHHFLLGMLSRGQYIEEFVFNYGEWHREFATRLWVNRGRSGAEPAYFEYPMLKRVVERSRAVVVHNARAAELVRQAGARVVEQIPHLFVTPELPGELAVFELRRRLGVGRSELLAGVFGHLRESKRVLPILQAVKRARREGVPVRLLVAGECVSGDLNRALELWKAEEWLIRKPYLGEDEFWAHAQAVDVCMNLRYPSAAETSGILIRLMGIGKTVVVTDGPEVADLPAKTCLRVPVNEDEQVSLIALLAWLAADRGRTEEIGRHAAWYIEQNHSAGGAALQYWNFLKTCVPEAVN